MAMPHPSTQSIGLAGEFFVAAELQRRGVHASLALGRTTDIVASNTKLGRFVNIEVSTTTADSWVIDDKTIRPEISGEHRFLALVRLPQSAEPPTIYIFGEWEFSDLLGGSEAKSKVKLRTLSIRKAADLQPGGGGWEKILSQLGLAGARPTFGSAKDQVKMSPDFDETPADFADYQ